MPLLSSVVVDWIEKSPVWYVFTFSDSSQQATGPRAADGRDSPVQETESRETAAGTTCKEEKLR